MKKRALLIIAVAAVQPGILSSGGLDHQREDGSAQVTMGTKIKLI